MITLLLSTALASPLPTVGWLTPDGAPVVVEWQDGDGALVASNLPMEDRSWFTEQVVANGPSAELTAALAARLKAKGFVKPGALMWSKQGAPYGVHSPDVGWIGAPGKAAVHWAGAPDGLCSAVLTGDGIVGRWAACEVGPSDSWVVRRVPDRLWTAAEAQPAVCRMAEGPVAGLLLDRPGGQPLPEVDQAKDRVSLRTWACDRDGIPRWAQVKVGETDSGWVKVAARIPDDASQGAGQGVQPTE